MPRRSPSPLVDDDDDDDDDAAPISTWPGIDGSTQTLDSARRETDSACAALLVVGPPEGKVEAGAAAVASVESADAAAVVAVVVVVVAVVIVSVSGEEDPPPAMVRTAPVRRSNRRTRPLPRSAISSVCASGWHSDCGRLKRAAEAAAGAAAEAGASIDAEADTGAVSTQPTSVEPASTVTRVARRCTGSMRADGVSS